MINDIIDNYRYMRGEVLDYLIPDPLDNIYVVTFIMVLVLYFEWGNIERWDELNKGQKSLIRALIFVTSVFIIGSVLVFIGVIGGE